MKTSSFARFLKEEILSRFQQADHATRLSIVFLLVLQLPLLNIIVNRTFLDWDIDRTPYMQMYPIECVRLGQPIYAPLSSEHVCLNYTPLYWWVCGSLCKLVGPSLVVARLVSLSSTLALVILLSAFVWRQTDRNLFLTVAAPCILLSTYSFMAPWMIEINVNALHVALGVAGFLLLSNKPSAISVTMAAVAMSLSALTKQTGLAYVVAGAFLSLLASRRSAMYYSITSVVVLIGICLGLNLSSHGEFFRQCVLGMQGPPWILGRLWDEVLSRQFLGLLCPFFLLALIPLMQEKRHALCSTLTSPAYVMCGTGMAVAFISQPKIGSGSLQSIMAIAGLVVCGCVGIHRLTNDLPPSYRSKVLLAIPFLQLSIVLLPACNTYSSFLVDGSDRQKYDQIAEVFRKGRTCMYGGYVYLPMVFGQPASAHYGDEFSRWSNGKMDYSNKPDFLSEPFRRKEIEFVILGIPADGADPTIRVIADNYVAVQKLPAHPSGNQGGTFRNDHIVLRRK